MVASSENCKLTEEEKTEWRLKVKDTWSKEEFCKCWSKFPSLTVELVDVHNHMGNTGNDDKDVSDWWTESRDQKLTTVHSPTLIMEVSGVQKELRVFAVQVAVVFSVFTAPACARIGGDALNKETHRQTMCALVEYEVEVGETRKGAVKETK